MFVVSENDAEFDGLLERIEDLITNKEAADAMEQATISKEEATQQKIKELALSFWEKADKPEERDLEFWLAAEREVLSKRCFWVKSAQLQEIVVASSEDEAVNLAISSAEEGITLGRIISVVEVGEDEETAGYVCLTTGILEKLGLSYEEGMKE